MTNDANFAYRETEVLTTDPVGLVVLLYDMLLKDLRAAIVALAAADIDRRAAAIRHCMLVLQELQGTLDMEEGGVVATNLENFYNFTRAKLLEGQIKGSAEIFEQQITFVSSIRDAWKQVRADQLQQEKAPATETTTVPPPVFEAEALSAAQWSA
jgi:flagellar secretion chaperone FliS